MQLSGRHTVTPFAGEHSDNLQQSHICSGNLQQNQSVLDTEEIANLLEENYISLIASGGAGGVDNPMMAASYSANGL